jgi:uncharacterized protein YdhG (YjbR/CyaY superfamily)
MQKESSPESIIEKLPDDRREAMNQLRKVIKKNLSKEFSECVNYGMISYVIPHSVYPKGYHCDPSLPLPFVSIASQKNNISLYHMGIYADKKLLDWFTDEYKKQIKSKLDMGKSCIRFKKPENIPYELIGRLIARMDAKKWITIYEKNLAR